MTHAHLHPRACAGAQQGALIEALVQNSSLTELNLSRSGLHAGAIELLAKGVLSKGGASGLATLCVLDLSGNAFGEAGPIALAYALANGALPRLRTLDLSDNRIGEAGVRALADAVADHVALDRLEALSLARNRIDDAALVALSAALDPWSAGKLPLPALAHLDLQRNRIGDAGVAALCDALGKGALEQISALELHHNQCGEQAVARLAAITNLRADRIARGRRASSLAREEAGGDASTDHPADG